MLCLPGRKESELVPKVWNKRDPNTPTDAVYIGRPSKWGNPFRIGQKYSLPLINSGEVLSRAGAIEAYRDWLLASDGGRERLLDIGELRGKDLVCWCAPLPCHGDMLLILANV